MAVPFGVGGTLVAAGGFGLLMCLSAGVARTPSPVHFVCMILMALFLCVIGGSVMRVGAKGFVKEVQVTEEGFTICKVAKSETFQWSELNRIAATDTGLNMRMMSGAEVDIDPSLSGFQELVDLVKERYRKVKGIKVPPRPKT